MFPSFPHSSSVRSNKSDVWTPDVEISWFDSLVDSEQVLAQIAKDVIEDFASEHVVYLELRTTPRSFPKTGLDKRGYIRTLIDVVWPDVRLVFF
jgi:adenosine deaminase